VFGLGLRYERIASPEMGHEGSLPLEVTETIAAWAAGAVAPDRDWSAINVLVSMIDDDPELWWRGIRDAMPTLDPENRRLVPTRANGQPLRSRPSMASATSFPCGASRNGLATCEPAPGRSYRCGRR